MTPVIDLYAQQICLRTIVVKLELLNLLHNICEKQHLSIFMAFDRKSWY
jgi:hypothetical protein